MSRYVTLVTATQIIESAFRHSAQAEQRDLHRAASVALAELSLVGASELVDPVAKLSERLLARADALGRWPDHAVWSTELRRLGTALLVSVHSAQVQLK